MSGIDRRDLILAGAAMATSPAVPAVGRPQQREIEGRPHRLDAEAFLARVDTELRATAAQLLEQPLDLTSSGLAKLRATYAAAVPALIPGVPVEEIEIAVKPSAPPVRLFVINAKPDAARPAILHTHGGGHIVGTARSEVPEKQLLARELGCVIVTVEYRLAPETTYTGSVEDNYAGLKWLHTNADRLGVNPRSVLVMGESAGGTHAALLAFAARDRGEVSLAGQVLVYPMLDDRTGSTRRGSHLEGAILWTGEANRIGWQSFLGAAPGGENVPVAAVPARRTDLVGLPPTYIAVGGLDLFASENIDFARRLNEAGVSTELLVVPGAFHGFDVAAPATRIAARFNKSKVDAIRRLMGQPSTA